MHGRCGILAFLALAAGAPCASPAAVKCQSHVSGDPRRAHLSVLVGLCPAAAAACFSNSETRCDGTWTFSREGSQFRLVVRVCPASTARHVEPERAFLSAVLVCL